MSDMKGKFIKGKKLNKSNLPYDKKIQNQPIPKKEKKHATEKRTK